MLSEGDSRPSLVLAHCNHLLIFIAEGQCSPEVLHISSIRAANVSIQKCKGPKKGCENCKNIKDNIRVSSGDFLVFRPLTGDGPILGATNEADITDRALRDAPPSMGFQLFALPSMSEGCAAAPNELH